jgi:hypothetical protein
MIPRSLGRSSPYTFRWAEELTSSLSNRDPNLIKHECLHPDELPHPGTLVAIDAEFVSMQQVWQPCLYVVPMEIHVSIRRRQNFDRTGLIKFFDLHGWAWHESLCYVETVRNKEFPLLMITFTLARSLLTTWRSSRALNVRSTPY